MLYVAGEDIRAGSKVVISPEDGKVYANGGAVFGGTIGTAAENLREGFRVVVRGGEIYEDDE
jgi:hypothetical protein